jgi:hypothetical protein
MSEIVTNKQLIAKLKELRQTQQGLKISVTLPDAIQTMEELDKHIAGLPDSLIRKALEFAREEWEKAGERPSGGNMFCEYEGGCYYCEDPDGYWYICHCIA